jgi:hypothetical protein
MSLNGSEDQRNHDLKIVLKRMLFIDEGDIGRKLNFTYLNANRRNMFIHKEL